MLFYLRERETRKVVVQWSVNHYHMTCEGHSGCGFEQLVYLLLFQVPESPTQYVKE